MRASFALLSGIAAIDFLLSVLGTAKAEDPLTGFDLVARKAAISCRDEVVAELEKRVASNTLTLAQIFDTFYIPIANTNPQKFHTQYDRKTDEVLRIILDKYLDQQSRFLFVVAVDKNGYLPTHNTRYQKPITGDPAKDRVGNRTKRVFNDPGGLKAAQNSERGLLQVYYRDSGETLWDVSSPIFVKGKHWGGFRIGRSLEVINAAKKQLMRTLVVIMSAILVLSLLLTFVIVNRSMAPLRRMTAIATELANGKNLQDEIAVTREDELGELQHTLNRLRLSMMIALKRKG